MYFRLLLFLVAVSTLAPNVSAALIFANNADAGVIKSYDITNGSTATYSLDTAQAVAGLAADDADQRLYVGFGSGGGTASPSNNLFTFDYGGHLLNSVRTPPSGGGLSFNGLTYGNSTLYGVRANGTNGVAGIYAIDPTTGNTTIKGALSQAGTIFYNFQDIDYDPVNNRFIGDNTTVTGPGGTGSGLFSIALPVNGSDLATVSYLAPLPADAPSGDVTPDGLAYDNSSGIVYLTYNRSTTISRFNLSTNTYLPSVTGPAQTQGASGDAAFASGFIGVPEPAAIACLAPLALAAIRFGRKSKFSGIVRAAPAAAEDRHPAHQPIESLACHDIARAPGE